MKSKSYIEHLESVLATLEFNNDISYYLCNLFSKSITNNYTIIGTAYKVINEKYPQFLEWIDEIGYKENKFYIEGEAWISEEFNDNFYLEYQGITINDKDDIKVIKRAINEVGTEEVFDLVSHERKVKLLTNYINQLKTN